MTTRYSNSAKSSTLRMTGEQLLQDPQQNYNYDGYQNDYAKNIQPKATGKLGANYFTETPVIQSIDTTKQLLGLKKKMKHQQLEEQGYFINDKRQINKQNNEYQGKEVELEIPVYEIFDPPNQNYRKQFQPTNLQPIVGYYYNEQVQDQEDLYVEEAEKKKIQAIVEAELKKDRKRDYLLNRLNQNLNDHHQKVKQEERKVEMDQAVMRVIMGQNNKKLPENPLKKKREKSNEDKQKINNQIEWIQNQQKSKKTLLQVGLGGKKKVIQPSFKQQELNNSLQIEDINEKEEQKEESVEKKNKHVTFGNDQVVEFNPNELPKTKPRQLSGSPQKSTKWREKSNSFREAIKAARGTSKQK